MGILSNLFAGGAASLIESVGKAIDKNLTSDEERISLENEIQKAEMEHKAEMRSLDIEETGLYLADVDSARESQTRIQESEHSSWLAKNTQHVVTYIVTIAAFAIFAAALFGGLSDNPVVMMILGGILAYESQILSYYFGSSRESGENSKKMSDMIGNGSNIDKKGK